MEDNRAAFLEKMIEILDRLHDTCIERGEPLLASVLAIAKGEAEDAFRLVDRSTTVKVPFGTFRHALRTEEQTALEPDVLDNKYWVRGIGQVEEVSVKGPLEKLLLVSVSIP